MSYYEMKYKRLIHTWESTDIKVYLEHVRILFRVRKQMSWKSQKLEYNNVTYLDIYHGYSYIII